MITPAQSEALHNLVVDGAERGHGINTVVFVNGVLLVSLRNSLLAKGGTVRIDADGVLRNSAGDRRVKPERLWHALDNAAPKRVPAR